MEDCCSSRDTAGRRYRCRRREAHARQERESTQRERREQDRWTTEAWWYLLWRIAPARSRPAGTSSPCTCRPEQTSQLKTSSQNKRRRDSQLDGTVLRQFVHLVASLRSERNNN